jgi:hypothetical protein
MCASMIGMGGAAWAADDRGIVAAAAAAAAPVRNDLRVTRTQSA